MPPAGRRSMCTWRSAPCAVASSTSWARCACSSNNGHRRNLPGRSRVPADRTRAARTRPGSASPVGSGRLVRTDTLEVAEARGHSRVGAVAAAMLFLGVSAAVANLEITYDSGGLSVRTGWMTRAPAPTVAPLRPSRLAILALPGATGQSLAGRNRRRGAPSSLALEQQLRSEMRSSAAQPRVRAGAPNRRRCRGDARSRACVDRRERAAATAGAGASHCGSGHQRAGAADRRSAEHRAQPQRRFRTTPVST